MLTYAIYADVCCVHADVCCMLTYAVCQEQCSRAHKCTQLCNINRLRLGSLQPPNCMPANNAFGTHLRAKSVLAIAPVIGPQRCIAAEAPNAEVHTVALPRPVIHVDARNLLRLLAHVEKRHAHIVCARLELKRLVENKRCPSATFCVRICTVVPIKQDNLST